MQVHILASGSSGNCILIDSGKVKLLIDAGISTRAIKQRLALVGTSPEELSGVLITHEHSDHVKGLPGLTKKYRLPIYTRFKTWRALNKTNPLMAECTSIQQSFNIGGIGVEVFDISHDASDPVGFCLHFNKKKVAVATDLGEVTNDVERAIAFSDLLVLEANHDLDLLNSGPYPTFLKKRITSSLGHLSNFDAANLLARCPRKEIMNVFLAHLSKQNNNPNTAEKTVRDVLTKQGCQVGKQVILHHTYPDQIASYISY